jgi:hypothetical protein
MRTLSGIQDSLVRAGINTHMLLLHRRGSVWNSPVPPQWTSWSYQYVAAEVIACRSLILTFEVVFSKLCVPEPKSN